MKLNTMAKGIIAASAILVAGYANAGAKASAEVTVDGLKIVTAGTTDVFTVISGQTNNFFGSTASTNEAGEDKFGSKGAAEFGGDPNPSFILDSTDVTGNATGTSEVTLTGSGTGAGATGKTFAEAIASGTADSQAEAVLKNVATVTVQNNGDTVVDTFSVELTFSYLYELVAESFNSWEQGSASSDATLSVDFTDTSKNSIFSETWSLSNFLGDANDTNGGFQAVTSSVFTLEEGKTYQLNVVQTTLAIASSVPEPKSLAIFALGLLGLARLSRAKAKK